MWGRAGRASYFAASDTDPQVGRSPEIGIEPVAPASAQPTIDRFLVEKDARLNGPSLFSRQGRPRAAVQDLPTEPAASSIRSLPLPSSRRCPPDLLHDLPVKLEVLLDAVDHALRVRCQPFHGRRIRGEEAAQCADLGPNVIDPAGPDKGHHCA